MKQIPRETIDEIRERNDIAEVIGSYISLKSAGGRFKALCPFHNEKTPSFTVSPDRQIYHCFGCDVGGDVIRFIQEYEKVDFMVALQMLADRAGMELNFEDADGQRSNKRELFQIHEGVSQLYHRVLLEHPDGEAGRAYLETRDLKPETVEAFRIGFAPDRFDALERWAQKKQIPVELMEHAGLRARSERGSTYDRFRKRLMFPILDEAGRTIGFSGRLIDPNDRGGKYVNSPETPLFRKSRVLFGIDKARKAMAEKRTAIIVEGQLDAIRCHEAGISNVVASQGTALTSDHARMVRRYADEVILVLDADAAGQKAALRSSEAFIAEELSVRVASLPAGEDPDSLIRTQGAEALVQCAASAVSALDFLINCSAKTENLKKEAGLMRTTRAVQELISHAPGAVQRDRMVQQAAERLGLSQSALRKDMARKKQTRPSPVAQSAKRELPVAPVKHPVDEVALLQMLFFHPEEVFPIVADHLPVDYLTDPDSQVLLELLLDHPTELMEKLPPDHLGVQRLAVRIQMEDGKLRGKEIEPARAAQDIIMTIWRRVLTQQRRSLQEANRLDEARVLTQQLYHLKQGWEHAVDFLVV